ncbi:MAG: LacI family transcriptional regulator [Chloroflexi bacterium]|nr:LacI family transcriptional regulator [Chloroflexota bacterium]
MSTIRDVAKLAGVSTATVSHVVNNSRTVRPETRKAVLDAIKRLNYRPSAIARSLTTNVTRTIGVLVANITSPFFAALVRGIENRLEAYGYQLIVCNTDEQASREARYLDLLLARRVDGMIIAPTGEPQPLWRDFVAHNIPLVFIDRKPSEPCGPVIALDNFAAGYAATEHLIRLGHRHIAILVRSPMLSTVVGRRDGYRQAFRDYKLPLDESLIYVSDYALEAAHETAQRLLTTSPWITAIIATNHTMTLGVLEALQEQYIKYPDDVSLVAFDDNPWHLLVTPPLTSIRLPIQELCDAAVTTLRAALEKKSARADARALPDVFVKAQLIARASCRKI